MCGVVTEKDRAETDGESVLGVEGQTFVAERWEEGGIELIESEVVLRKLRGSTRQDNQCLPG